MTNNDIKQAIDSCIGKESSVIDSVIKDLMNRIIPYVLSSYSNSRQTVQFALGQLERMHTEVVRILLQQVLDRVESLSGLFEKASEDYNEYVKVKWKEDDVRAVMQKIPSYFQGNIHLNVPNMAFADNLSPDERRKFISFIIDSIQYYGTDTQWKKDTIGNHQLYLAFLYAICKKDGQMWYLFLYANNFIGRLATSGEAQAARDMAENMLMIGHQEGMEAEAYFCASRAYTIVHNPLAGLFYLEIAIRKWLQQMDRIPYKTAFELLWQIVKIARSIRFCSEKHLKPVADCFDGLQPLSYDIVSFYHTYLSLMFIKKGEGILSDVADFLEKNKESVYANLNHSAMPWLSLIATMKLNFPDADLTRLTPYINTFKGVVNRERNSMMLDMFDGVNEDVHLKELMVRLQSTRNVADFSHDNQYAMILAKSLLTKACQEQSPSKFLLAMHARADYTFVRPEIRQKGLYRKTEFKDVNGAEYNLHIEDTELLQLLMQQGANNEVMWIGKGKSLLHFMTLLNNQFVFGNLDPFSRVDVKKLQSDLICHLQYKKDVKNPGESIYIKGKDELEQEAEELRRKLSDCQISVDNNAERLFMVKDMDVAAYPHQLLVDINKGKFIGELLPTCNIISTEVLIKTNFDNPLSDHPSCSFWCPTGSQEFTFAMIKSSLDDVFGKYNIACNERDMPERPIEAEINIACAHGGADISDTQWFYADGSPIVETGKIIGRGKLLILFVCHSGSITRHDYDNAMHTLIKRYIRAGYSSVIAPMWSLSTDILQTWLDVFMEEIMNKQFVIDALYKANMAVKEQFTSPEVYACLHLFGNPFLQIADKPVLEICK